MKLTNVALSYAYTCAEAEAILAASAPEVIPFLHKKDLRLLTRTIAAYNVHGLSIHSIHVPRVSCGYIWPRMNNFLYSGKIFSVHVVVFNPKIKKKKIKNLAFSYILDVRTGRLIAPLELQRQAQKEAEAHVLRQSPVKSPPADQVDISPLECDK